MMLHRLMMVLTVAILALAIARPAAAQEWRLVNANTIAPDEYVILTIPLQDPEAMSTVAADLEAEFGVTLAAEWPLNSIAVLCLVYDASATEDVDALLVAMESDTRVRTAQRIQGFGVSEISYPDTLLPMQWAMDKMNVMMAHKSSLGAGVRVGIVDSAIDQTHPDLVDRVADARDFVQVRPEARAEPHGTAVAGVIGAAAINDGIVGIAPKAELIGLRACWQDDSSGSGACNTFSLARAINFAILNDIDILNMSLGGPEDALLAELLEEAMAQNMVIVAAAGEGEELVFPALVDGVIAAGAPMPDRIPAPMVDVLSTAVGSGHRYVSGSSIATAHVSGVAALILAKEPELSAVDVANRLAAAVKGNDNATLLDACYATAELGVTCNE